MTSSSWSVTPSDAANAGVTVSAAANMTVSPAAESVVSRVSAAPSARNSSLIARPPPSSSMPGRVVRGRPTALPSSPWQFRLSSKLRSPHSRRRRPLVTRHSSPRLPLSRALDQRADNLHAPVRAENGLGHPLRMRHQAGHVAGRVAYTGDRPQGAVRVRRLVRIEGGSAVFVDVPEEDLAVRLQFVEHGFIGVVAALTVGDWDAHRRTCCRAGEGRVEPLGLDVDEATGKTQRPIAQQRARYEPGLREDLEAVADAQNQATRRREFLHTAHHRREARDNAGSNVVTVGETARQDHARNTL